MDTMQVEAATDEDRAFVLEVLSNPEVDWRVAAVRAMPGYSLSVRFRDGLQGTVLMRDRVLSSSGGVFTSLASPETFDRVSVDEGGAVVWENGMDLAPDAMYFAIKAHGEWILR